MSSSSTNGFTLDNVLVTVYFGLSAFIVISMGSFEISSSISQLSFFLHLKQKYTIVTSRRIPSPMVIPSEIGKG
jgi:hypothetical protein